MKLRAGGKWREGGGTEGCGECSATGGGRGQLQELGSGVVSWAGGLSRQPKLPHTRTHKHTQFISGSEPGCVRQIPGQSEAIRVPILCGSSAYGAQMAKTSVGPRHCNQNKHAGWPRERSLLKPNQIKPFQL